MTKIEDQNGNGLQFTNFTPSHQPQLITNASGRSINLNWSGGKLSQSIDSSGTPARIINYNYDLRGNLIEVIDPLGQPVSYLYDARSRLVKITDAGSSVVNIVYSDEGAVTNIVSPGGSGTENSNLSFSYDTLLHKTVVDEIVNAGIQTTVYSYDSLRRVTHIEGNCCGYDVQYQYDASNNITSMIDANGNQSYFTFDTSGNCLSATDHLSQTELWTYEPTFNRATSYTDKKGNVTLYAYDIGANLLSVSRPLSITESYTYDAFGNMSSATDGRGNVTTYTYDSYGNPLTMTRPVGTENYTYDNSGNLISLSDANGHITTYTYDVFDRLTTMIDALSSTTTYAYDANGNLVSRTDPGGHVTSYSYNNRDQLVSTTTPTGTTSFTRDARGNVGQVVDNNGNLTLLQYDTRNRLIGVTDPLSHSRTFTYDDNGNRLSATDFNGNLTSYEYDALDRLVKITDALAGQIHVAYDANNNLSSVQDPNGNVTSCTYDALDRRIGLAYPLGSRNYSFDAAGNLTAETDPNGNTTTYAYDANNRLTSTVDPLAHTITRIYDAGGNLTSLTDKNGLTTILTYDAADRLLSTTNAMGEVEVKTYDADGKETSLSLPHGNVMTYGYDAADRLTSISDVIGTVAHYSYDPNSNITSASDGNGNTISYTYDMLNRMVLMTSALGQTSTFAYDDNGNPISSSDGEGNLTLKTYDALNRRISETYPGGSTTTWGHDPAGNLVSLIDGAGNATLFEYDGNNRPVKTTYADASTRTFTYDPVGNLTALVDQNSNTLAYTYDAMNRLIERSYPDTASDTYGYDAGGRLVAANNAAATVVFTYDAADRPLTEVLNGKTTSYSYDIPGRSVAVTYPGGRIVTSDMNQRLLNTSIQSNATAAADFSYDGGSRLLSQVNANGTTSSYTFNNNDWMVGIAHTAGLTPVGGFNYTFDGRGFRTIAANIQRPTHSEKYEYDPASHLVEFKLGTLSGGDIPSPLTQTQYLLDAVGNRTVVTKDSSSTFYSPNIVNAYTSIMGVDTLSPTYDANGNLTSDGSRALYYDYMDRLKGVVPGGPTGYQYDALGRRIFQANGLMIRYYYDGEQIIEERDLSDSVTASYVYGQGIDDVLSMTRYLPAPANYFYHKNSLGSIIAVTDDSGRVVERYEYDAFGKATIYDSAYNVLTNSAIGNRFMFTGREYDRETGFYYYRARHYDPAIGRFLQQDPLLFGDPPDIRNGYAYVANNPINFIDPTGTMQAASGIDRERNAQYDCWEINDGQIKCITTCSDGKSRLYYCHSGDASDCGESSLNDWCGAAILNAGGCGGNPTTMGSGIGPQYAAIKNKGVQMSMRMSGIDPPGAAIKNKGVQLNLRSDDADAPGAAIKNKGVQLDYFPGGSGMPSVSFQTLQGTRETANKSVIVGAGTNTSGRGVDELSSDVKEKWEENQKKREEERKKKNAGNAAAPLKSVEQASPEKRFGRNHK